MIQCHSLSKILLLDMCCQGCLGRCYCYHSAVVFRLRRHRLRVLIEYVVCDSISGLTTCWSQQIRTWLYRMCSMVVHRLELLKQEEDQPVHLHHRTLLILKLSTQTEQRIMTDMLTMQETEHQCIVWHFTTYNIGTGLYKSNSKPNSNHKYAHDWERQCKEDNKETKHHWHWSNQGCFGLRKILYQESIAYSSYSRNCN